tara:strand:+ start:994 stop:1428 length:435 start_codon:yes stop_codon:yes gene_type:complete
MNKKFYLLLFMLLVFVVVLLVSAAVPREYILLEIYYDGDFVLVNKSLESGFYPSINHDIDVPYEVKLMSEEDELYSNTFDHTILYSDAIIEENMDGKTELLDEINFFVVVPSVRDGEKVEILKDGVKVFEEEVYDVGATPCKVE